MTSAIRAQREDEQGFTLIELLVVVIIIGILAAIAIPAFLNQRERAWQSELTSTVRNIALEVEADATAAGGNYVNAIADTDNDGAATQGELTAWMTAATTDLQGAAATPVVMTATLADFTANAFLICGRHVQIDGDGDGTLGEDDHYVAYDSDNGGLTDYTEAADICA